MHSHIEAHDVPAPCELVWQTLVDLDRYSGWNTTITRAEGSLREGERLRLELDLGGRRRPFDPVVVEVRPQRLVLLEKVLLHPRVLRATHAFRVDPLPGGGTRLTQEWQLSGLLAPLVWPRFRAGLPAFGRMNRDLAGEVARSASHA